MDKNTVRDKILDLREGLVQTLFYICQGDKNIEILKILSIARSTIDNRIGELNKIFEIEGSSNTEKRRNLMNLTCSIVNDLIPDEESLNRWELKRLEILRGLAEQNNGKENAIQKDPKTIDDTTKSDLSEFLKKVSVLEIDRIEIEGLRAATGEIQDIQEIKTRDTKQEEEIRRLREEIQELRKAMKHDWELRLREVEAKRQDKTETEKRDQQKILELENRLRELERTKQVEEEIPSREATDLDYEELKEYMRGLQELIDETPKPSELTTTPTSPPQEEEPVYIPPETVWAPPTRREFRISPQTRANIRTILLIAAIFLIGYSLVMYLVIPNWQSIISRVIPPPREPTITYTFSSNSHESWDIYGGDLSNPGSGGNTGGNNDGYLLSNNWNGLFTSYFIAPSKYHGDWTKYDEMRLDLRSEGNFASSHGCSDMFKCEGDILVNNGAARAVYRLRHYPTNKWKTFTIPLSDDGNWTVVSGNLSLEQIFSKVNHFEIRAKFRESVTGFNETGLDNIAFFERD